MIRRILLILFVVFWSTSTFAQTPNNFKRENLVAWCIVPFDALQRTPQQRAEMLKELGLTKCAYDWRAHHVQQFEDEIKQYRQHNIEFFAFWDEHPTAFELFQKHQIKPQVWKTLTPDPSGKTMEEKLDAAIQSILPIAERTRQSGLQLGLYNHGGWGGEPNNLVAVCKSLRARGFAHVGIVYNFHHGHGHIHDFKAALKSMSPFLLCLNLNGMVDPSSDKYKSDPQNFKIRPISAGDYERAMIKAVIDSGYTGPIGILGHVAERDVKKVLQENLKGLESVLKSLEKSADSKSRSLSK